MTDLATESANVHPFPEDRRVRHVLPPLHDDQVAVTHRGHTTVYDAPADLHAAVFVARGDLIRAAIDGGTRRGRAQGRLEARTRFARLVRARRRAARARLKADAILWAAVAVVSAVGARLLGVFG